MSKPTPIGGLDFPDSTPFLVLRCVGEYASYLVASRFTDMLARPRALTVCDRHSVLSDTDVGEWVNRWLLCRGRSMSVSRCICSKLDYPFVC